MKEFSHEFNELLVNTFNVILKIQEFYIKKLSRSDLSVSEVHVIEKIGHSGEEGIKVSGVASALAITIPSATVSLNKLSKKGYVNKVKSNYDGRTCYCFLTEKGQQIFDNHQKFHDNMIKTLFDSLTEEEAEILHKGVVNMNKFFNDMLDDLKYKVGF